MPGDPVQALRAARPRLDDRHAVARQPEDADVEERADGEPQKARKDEEDQLVGGMHDPYSNAGMPPAFGKLGLLRLHRDAELAELLPDLLDRRHAEVLALDEILLGPLQQVADGHQAHLLVDLADAARPLEVAQVLLERLLADGAVGHDARPSPGPPSAPAGAAGGRQAEALGAQELLQLAQRRAAEVRDLEQVFLALGDQVAE